MIQTITIYKENRKSIEGFLLENISNNISDKIIDKHLNKFFKIFKSLEMLFVTDKNHQQFKAKLTRDKKETETLPIDRVSTFEKRVIKDGKYVSAPYISVSTGHTIITVIRKIEDNYLVMDFNLNDLLEEMGYVTHSLFFTKINKFIYAIIGYGFYLLSLILILYSILTFGSYLFYYDASLIEATFKSIVSITLGLAIFDLGKNLLEHEVIYNHEAKKDNINKVFIGFLISIIIAISIEALIFVFKVMLSKEYSDMVYALYLIGGVSMLIISLSLFSRFSRT
ncbi:MAG: cache domain-containing protein [Sulfurimonas sp.]|nr:cache domain-containing protein [Sulfurimonas sp.]